MKMRLRSIIKCNSAQFDFFESSQVLVQTGSNLCVKQLEQRDFTFIPLYKNIEKLMCFKTSPGSKAIFTIELNEGHIEACSYNIKGDRKVVKFIEPNSLFPVNQIQKYGILCDQFDSTLAYGYVSTKTDSCVFLLDFAKSKVVSIGYIAGAQQIIPNHKDTYTLSACGKGFIRCMKPVSGHWDAQDKNIKKLMYEHFQKHLWLTLDRYLGITNSSAFFVDCETHDVIQNFELNCQKINHVMQINNGLIFVVDFNRVMLYLFVSQDDRYVLQASKTLESSQKKPIKKMIINDQGDIVLMRTQDLEFYQWKLDSITNPQPQDKIKFEKIQNIHADYTDGAISVCSGKNYSLILQRNLASLWDIQKNSAVIKVNFSSFENDNVKTLYTGAINPDGHSFILAFPDRIKFYRILLSSFKHFAEFQIKKCRIISYSHGGQLVACQSGRSPNSMITVFNTLRLREVFARKINADIQQIVWNQHDDQIYVSTSRNQVLCFKIADKEKNWELSLQKHINFLRFDYKINRLVASTDDGIYTIANQKQYNKIEPRVLDFHYVFPVESNYLMVNKKGSIFWSSTIEGTSLQELKVFANEPINLAYRKQSLVAYSDMGSSLLIEFGKSMQKTNEQQGQIIMVEKEQIIKFFDKVKVLQNNFESLQNTSQIRFDKELQKYDCAMRQNKKKFLEQIDFLQKKVGFLQSQKLKQEKDHTKIFEDLEDGQVRNVSDLQKIYDRKLKLEKQKYMTLQQENLQAKLAFDKKYKELENRYHNDIERVRKEYERRIQEQVGKQNQSKEQHLNVAKKMETRLIAIEHQSEETLCHLQRQKDSMIQSLIERITRLERDIETTNVSSHNLQDQFEWMKREHEKALKDVQESQERVLQFKNRVRLLEQQVQERDKMVNERNSLIEHHQQHIAGLEKAKYVLGFRTNQIRKELEPKEALIQKLKSAILKQDEEFKQKTQRIFDLQQKLEKVQKVAEYTKKDLNHYKHQLKASDKVHEELCAEIFNVANFIDQKEWVNQLVKIYRKFIKEEKYSNVNGKKTDKTSEQINRHLVHVEQSLLHVSTGNQKALKGTKMQVKRKMMENADLVFDLNNMRKKQNELYNELKQKNMEIARLKRQISEQTKSTRNCNTANTGVTRRVNASRQQKSTVEGNQTTFDLNLRRASDYLIPERSKRSNRILSANKTVMWREDPKRQKTKMITDLARQLESAKNTIKRQDRMIQQLNQRLLGLPEDVLI